MYQVYQWDDESNLKKLNTYQYWNNEGEEKKKAWDIRDGNYKKLEQHIINTGLKSDLKKALRKSGLCKLKSVKGIELGGGVCWTAPILFDFLNIEEMQFLEFSEHRIRQIAPLILEYYQMPEDKIKLILGSFYDIKCTNESMDFILLSQTLHHAENVDVLLAEMYRILKKKGIVIIIGEHNCGKKFVFKCMLERLGDIVLGNYHSDRILLHKQWGCLALDQKLGDRYYSLLSYAKMFRKHGFECKRIRTKKKEDFGFILYKQ